MTEPRQLPPETWSGPPAARLRDLPEPTRSQFRDWLRGRAIPHLEGLPPDQQDGFFLHDYRNWRAGGDPPFF